MKVHRFLADRSKWTHKAVARNKHSTPCSATSESAVRWCLIGAIYKCYPHSAATILDRVTEKILDDYNSIGEFNDECGHARVLKLAKELGI